MNIKSIVKDTLKQIAEGVKESGQTTGKEPRIQFSIDLILPSME